MFKFNRESEALYKYEEIAQDIERSIAEGELKAYEQLPTVVELCDKYDASKSTIQQVITELSDRGLITRRRGAGMFVKSFAMESDLYWQNYNRIINYKEDPNEEQEVTIDLDDLAVVRPPAEVSHLLDMDNHAFAYSAKRVMRTKSGPFAVEYVYIPIDLAAGFKYEDATGSIIKFASDKLGLKVSSIHKSVRAAMPTTEERARLQISFGQPLLEMERVAFLADGRPYEYALTRYRGDKFEYRAIDNL